MRRMLISVSCLTAVLAAPLAAVASPDPKPVVATADGKVQGQAEGSVYSFLGIHYGADTGGQNRFLPPKPATPWAGVFQASAMGARCPQIPLNRPGHPPTQVIYFSEAPTSEDCLDLNVWTPKPGKGKRPVMVWIHGGGFSFGSANDQYYEGSKLAGSQDVVVVSLNHRLNAFGYLNLGPDAGPQYAHSANAGMLDIVQALQWVKANIAQFGGDPNNVTIFGQSGGGGKVSALLGMPAAHGLFEKAIIESGSDLKGETPAESLAQRDRILAALKLTPADAMKLRDIPAPVLALAAAKAGILIFHPTVDGDVLPADMFDPQATPISADVPLLVGHAHDEVTDLLINDPTWATMTDADLQTKAAALLGGPDKAKVAIAIYKARAPSDPPSQIYASLFTDQMFTKKTIAQSDRKSAQRAPVYAYRVDWKSPVLDGVLRSPHGVELPFVFDNVASGPELVGSGPSQERMAKLMSASFANFARTGNPSVKGYPKWPTYDVQKRETFIFDDPPRVVSDPEAKVRSFLADH
jgi:para-nitrobenzyl esterase